MIAIIDSLTLFLSCRITGQRTQCGILVTPNAVDGTFSVTFGTGCIQLGLASEVLFLARTLPLVDAGNITNLSSGQDLLVGGSVVTV
jgi:hypothetical protein